MKRITVFMLISALILLMGADRKPKLTSITDIIYPIM